MLAGMKPFLLATDLDRTLIPNGVQPESPQALPRLRELAARPEVTLVFVTGRHRAIVEEAIEQWGLPVPDYAIADVGTSLYKLERGNWSAIEAWTEEIRADWSGVHWPELAHLFEDLDVLTLQEKEKEGRFKLSYYAPPDTDVKPLRDEMLKRLNQHGVRAQVIWSVDETIPIGLLDVLPASADKLQALCFLVRHLKVEEQQVMFAGDSGNDLPILTSGLQAVLVANAHASVRASLGDFGDADKRNLYLARGGYDGMNGNYAAGILEGLAHFGFVIES